jgi:hypothetical protein
MLPCTLRKTAEGIVFVPTQAAALHSADFEEQVELTLISEDSEQSCGLYSSRFQMKPKAA